MEELVSIITNQGIGVACVLYMMYFQNTYMKSMNDVLSEIKEELIYLRSKIDKE